VHLKISREWARALVALLLACLLAQGTAVQAHLHFATQASPAASAAHIAKASPRGSDDSAAKCPLCQEAATAGAYLLPVAIVLSPAPAAFVWLGTPAIVEFGLPAPVRGWLSRAPPR
jgi:hypothetical protein